MSEKLTYPDIEAFAEMDDYGNVFVVKDRGDSGKRYTFDYKQCRELFLAAKQDLLMRIDNFERSPVPPPIITQAVVIHAPERNAVSVSNLNSEPSAYDFSAPQWRVICMAVSAELVRTLDRHTEQRKQEKGV